MSQISPGGAATDEARMELGAAAMSADRRNRPLWLLWAAGLLLVIAMIYALTGMSTRSEAERKLEAARAREAKFASLIGDIKTLKAAEAARGFAPDPRVVSKLEMMAREMGLKLAAPISESDSSPGSSNSVTGMNKRTYVARVVNEDPSTLLKWLEAIRSGPGLSGVELSQIRFNTGNGTYAVEVQFTRWEKRS